MNRQISAIELKEQILSHEELAVLDIREEGIYFESHLLWASNVPLSRLELHVDDLLPRKTVQIVVYDSGPEGKNTAAKRAWQRLTELGYSNVRVLTGGTEGWKQTGFELFSGLNVPSKTFGEYLLQRRKPPEIHALQLNERLVANDNLVVLDSRPMDEYNAMSIPNAVDVPGAELVYRVFEIAPDSATDVVVNCAGRTRSIVGAMSLINAEIPNRVMLLRDGTMGWHLAGLELNHGETKVGRAPSEENFRKSCEAAKRVASRFNVPLIDTDTLSEWCDDKERTLYIFDVRTHEEYLEGHLPGSRHAPGGQLVQTTDEFIAVKNSRIALVDDRKVRAVMTASWLIQMGHRNVVVVQKPFQNAELESGQPSASVAGLEEHEIIEPGELKAVMQSGEPTLLVDLCSSRNYRARHIPQAHWCIRQRLESALVFRRPIGLLVLTSDDGTLAHLAARDMSKLGPNQIVRVLNGGNRAWQDLGFPMIEGMNNLLCEVDDIWERPYDSELGQEQRIKNYLEWEVQLMDQAIRDGTTDFHC